MYVRARSRSTPLDSSCPVVSRPTWRVYEVRSCSWSSDPNTISTCSTVLRSPARTLSTRERTRRPPSWARAQRRSAPSPMSARRCWNTTWSGPSSWRLAIARRAWAPEPDLRGGRQERLGSGPGRVVRDQLLDDRGLGPVLEDDQRPADQGARGAERPAQHDRPLDADAGRDVHDDPGRPRGPRELGELLVDGQERRALEQRARERARRWRPARGSVSRRTPAAAAFASIERAARPSSRISMSPATPSGAAAPAVDPSRPVYGAAPSSAAARRSRYGV